jgi:peptide deformylase
MALREIRLVPEPILRQKAKKVSKITPALQKLMDDMVETMRESQGVGLAAPQVGILQRIIVVEVKRDEQHPDIQEGFYQLVNPEFTGVSQELEEGREGCLSIPGFVGDLDRAVAVEVKGLDRQGKPVKIRAYGYLARVLQHELDHLNGILYLDRLKSPDKLHELKDIEEQEKVAPE